MSTHSSTGPGRRQVDGLRGRAALVAVGIVAVQALFVLCLGYPPLHAAPHHVPIGVAGPPQARASVSTGLTARPGAFEVHRYSDATVARAAIHDRQVYGAIVVSATGPRLLVASAADPKVAALLTEMASDLGQQGPAPVTDVVPLPDSDPQGTGALATLLPLVLLSIVLGAVLSLLEPIGWALLGWCGAAAAAAGLAVAGVAAGLGTFTGVFWANAGVLGLLVFGVAATSAGLTRNRHLRPVEALFALTMLMLGIPSAGALVPVDLLPQPWRAVGPFLPPGAALDAIRGVAFFDGAAVGASMGVLAGWAVLGVLLLLVVPARRGRARTATEMQVHPAATPAGAGRSA